jgi:transcriptional regulator with XRE-family HTH domain
MDIGTKIKVARINKGMTQEELGKVLGVQKSAIAKYENGRIVNIKRSTLKKISDVLDIRPSELIFDYEEEQKNKPTNNGELSEGQRKLYEFIETVPEDKIELVLRVMKSIVEGE